ncbi:MAG: low molecular weight phosphatase family protein [Lapillicoccus sp.]
MTSAQVGARGGRVLVVCTGNVCRSPFIERMLRVSVPASVVVTSAGTQALVGESMEPASADLVRRHGGDPDGFVARQLTAKMIAGVDLVLTATRAHRAAVASLQPASLRYAFTFGDFSDLAVGADRDLDGDLAKDPTSDTTRDTGADHPAGSWVSHVARVVADRRGLVPPRNAAEVDIVDPYGRGDEVYGLMAQQVLAALPPVLKILGG